MRDRASEPFAYGSNDCLLFCADAVLAVTGIDLAEGFRTYDEATANEVTGKHDLASLFKLVLGPSHRNFRAARRGDIVIMKIDGRLTGGVVDDSGGRIAALMPNGLARRKLEEAWRIWSY